MRFLSRVLPRVAVVGAVAILICIILGYVFGWTWTGFPGHSLWDWIDLLIVPLGLALVATLFNNWRATREQEQTAEDQREQALRDYLDAMTDLMLEHNLPSPQSEEVVRTVARTRTLALLRRLDGERKGLVLRFLYDSNLLVRHTAVIRLVGADLSSARLESANLQGADLGGVDLTRAYLGRANLQGADLRGARLTWSDLSSANLQGTDLSSAWFEGSDLNGADLKVADLHAATLWAANLQHADFRGANMRDASFNGADFAGAELQGADLNGAILARAQLRFAHLIGANLSEAVANDQTTWPDHFDTAAQHVRIVNLRHGRLAASDQSTVQST